METRETPPAIKTVEHAIVERFVLRLTYITVKGETEELVVEPLAIRFNSAGHRVLWAWDRNGEHIEQLLLSGVQASEETGQEFEPRVWDAGPEDAEAR